MAFYLRHGHWWGCLWVGSSERGCMQTDCTRVDRIVCRPPQSVIMKAGLWFAACSAIYRACHCAGLSVPWAGCLVARGAELAAPLSPTASSLALLSLGRGFSFPPQFTPPIAAASVSCCYLILMHILLNILLLHTFFVLIDLLSCRNSLLLIPSCLWVLDMAEKLLKALFRKSREGSVVAGWGGGGPGNRLWEGGYVQEIDWGSALGLVLLGMGTGHREKVNCDARVAKASHGCQEVLELRGFEELLLIDTSTPTPPFPLTGIGWSGCGRDPVKTRATSPSSWGKECLPQEGEMGVVPTAAFGVVLWVVDFWATFNLILIQVQCGFHILSQTFIFFSWFILYKTWSWWIPFKIK